MGEPPPPTEDSPIMLVVLGEASAPGSPIAMRLFPEVVGAEESLDELLAEQQDIASEKETRPLAGPEVVEYTLTALGGSGGIAAIISAWTRRHRDRRFTIHFPGGSIAIEGQPMDAAELARLAQIFGETPPDPID